MLGTMYRWCVYAFSSGLWNIPTPEHQVLYGRVVQTQVKIDALCEHCWPPEQHAGKKSWNMLHLLYHQGSLETVYLQQESDHVCLWPGCHLYHGYSGVVRKSTGEWNDLLLSSLMRVSSVCMRVVDVRIRVWNRPGERRLPEYICPRHTDHTSGFMVWGASVTTRGHIWCSCRIK